MPDRRQGRTGTSGASVVGHAYRSAILSGYQKFVIGTLAALQFTITLDSMVISPLGAVMMPTLHINPRQFGLAISAYALTAGVSGLIAASFADRFDRKRLLLFFYVGFMMGTLLCALANTYPMLLVARVVTGLFGGVIGSIVLAIATDLFPFDIRGRALGIISVALAVSQVVGVPASLYLADYSDWHAPFWAIILIGALAALVILFGIKPITAHLALKQERMPWVHLANTLTERRNRLAFILALLLPAGGSMLMPFNTAYIVSNIGLTTASLPTIFLTTGLCMMFAGPVLGKVSDIFGKFSTFCVGSALAIPMIAVWTNLGRVSLTIVILVNVVLFIGTFSRLISAQALISAIPEITKRGAFNAINASLQQLASGSSAAFAGVVIIQARNGALQNFSWLGYIAMAGILLSLLLMYFLHLQVKEDAMTSTSRDWRAPAP